MKTEFKISRQNVFVIAFFILLAGLLSLLFSLLEPFLSSFVWATILVMVFYPAYARLLHWTGRRATLAAVLATLIVMAFLLLPGFFVGLNLGKELPKAYAFLSSTQWDEKSLWLVNKLKSLNANSWLENWGVDSSQYELEVQKQIATALQNASHLVLEKVTAIFKNLAGFALHAVFVCVAVFFFFRDGARLSLKAIELLPLEEHHQQKVAQTFSVTVTAVVRAIFLTAFLEGILASLGFIVTGVPVPVLLGLLVFVAAFIPFVGATAVWVPAAIWLFYQDHTLAAAGLVVWGSVVSAVDHIMRPLLIGSEAKLPIFWLFFTTIGGLEVYGFLGIFLGPIILSLGMAFLSIYREIYLNLRKTPAPRRRS